KFLPDLFDVRRAPRIKSAGEGVRRAIGDRERGVQVRCANHGEHRTKDLLLRHARFRSDVSYDRWADETTNIRERSHVNLQHGAPFALCALDGALDSVASVRVDYRADDSVRIVRRPNGHRLRGLDESREEGLVDVPDDDRSRA